MRINVHHDVQIPTKEEAAFLLRAEAQTQLALAMFEAEVVVDV